MKNYRKDFWNIANTRYLICMAITALIAYGFAAFNPTFSVDDLQVDYYIGSEKAMLAAGRFTMTLLGVLFNYIKCLPVSASSIDLLATVAFVWAAVNYCILLRRICGDRFTDSVAVLFSCTLISYPLIIEIWEYTAANLCVTMGYLLVSFALLMMQSFLHGSKDWRFPAGAAVLLMFVCASYESLVVVYIFAVFAVLMLQVIFGSGDEKKVKTILLQGICYAAVLFAGLILEVLVHKLILFAGNMEPVANGARTILWPLLGFKEGMQTVLVGILSQVVLKGIIYFPITELLVACAVLLVIGVVLCKKYGASVLLPWFGCYLSLFVLPLLQAYEPMYRTCQVYGMFVAFTLALVGMALEKCRFSRIRAIAFFLAGFLVLHQAMYVNYFLTLNHYRSEAENRIVEDIGDDLQDNFPADKPVIFMGSPLTLKSDIINDQIMEAASIPERSLRWRAYRKITWYLAYALDSYTLELDAENRKLPDTLINSVISFGIYSVHQKAMQDLFSFNGYDYVRADTDALIDETAEYVTRNNIPAYPQEGYIVDVGEYLIVHIP